MRDKYIDIHSHVLWDIDDGSKDFGETINLCDMAMRSGTGQLFLTPHLIYWDNAGDLFDERERKIESLTDFLEEEEFELKIHTGFEILCDDDIFDVKYSKSFTNLFA